MMVKTDIGPDMLLSDDFTAVYRAVDQVAMFAMASAEASRQTLASLDALFPHGMGTAAVLIALMATDISSKEPSRRPAEVIGTIHRALEALDTQALLKLATEIDVSEAERLMIYRAIRNGATDPLVRQRAHWLLDALAA